MKKNDITILVVEDDKNFGAVVKEALTKSGFKVLLVQKPEDAVNSYKIQEIHAFLFDCLLPAKSGVDLASELRKLGAISQPMFFMSGIYKDKGFIKEALQKTSGVEFFTKPFDLSALTSAFEKHLGELTEAAQEPLQVLYSTPIPSPGERILAIEETPTISGLELPFVIHLLMHPSITGILHVTENSKSVGEIHFFADKIMSVIIDDPKSFFGAILVEKNFIRPEELELALAKPSEKRVGERLVDENLISPHVIDIVNAEQTGLRLSKMIRKGSFDIRFNATSVTPRSSYIDRNRLNEYFSAWTTSKFDLDYLKTFYLPRINSTFKPGPLAKTNSLVLTMPPLSYFPNLITSLSSGNATLANVLDSQIAPEDQVYLGLHLLILSGHLVFNVAAHQQDLESMIGRLKKIEAEMESQDHFQLLGTHQKAKPAEIKKAYYDLAKIFHPDKVQASSSTDLKELVTRVFSRMTKAYEILSNDQTRSSYLKELEMGQADKILRSEALFEEGKAALRSGQATKALSLLKEAIALRPPPAELILYEIWARMLCLSQVEDKVKELRDLEAGLNKIAPEERHTAIYYFVKGVFQKNLGNSDQAKRSLQHALSLAPTFIEAKRELNLINVSDDNKDVDLLRGDLKDVMGALFKKKKKSG
jgi:curved DNA-binding protein CbpA/CheY-like chemotaxis protein